MIVGNIVEKPSSASGSAPPPPRPPSASSGHSFPPVLHRSQRKTPTSKFSTGLQKVGESSTSTSPRVEQDGDDENSRRVAAMSREEREEEVQELKERFGPGLEELMRRRREKRLLASQAEGGAGPGRNVGEPRQDGPSSSPAEEGAGDGGSPEKRGAVERAVIDLPERMSSVNIDAQRSRTEKGLQSELEESSGSLSSARPGARRANIPLTTMDQEDLKAKYFPDLPSEPAKLAWTQSTASGPSEDDAPRFDLSGKELSAQDMKGLPSNIGLHHHGSSPDLAGYTIDEVIHLCQSTVTSQRITMMGVLTQIITNYIMGRRSDKVKRSLTDKRICEQGVNFGVGAILLMSKSAGVFRAGVELFYESLGASQWGWMDGQVSTAFRPTEAHVDLASVAWEDIVPTFGEMLDTDSLSPRTTNQIIRILRRLAVLSDEHCELVTPLLPVMVRTHILLRPWPSTPTSKEPSVEVLALMSDIIESSRRCAVALVDQGIIEPLLKFPLSLTWDDTPTGRELTHISLRIIGSLGRYGLSTTIAKSGSEPLDRLRQWLPIVDARDITIAFFELLRTWTVCATDPHKTTPEHDLTWAQVSALGWAEDVVPWLGVLAQQGRMEELASGLGLMLAWVKGAEINGNDRGSEEKRVLTSGLTDSGLVTRLLESQGSGPGYEAALAQIIQINLIANEVLLPSDSIAGLVQRHEASSDPILRYQVALLGRQAGILDNANCSRIAFDLLPSLQVGSEPIALDLIDTILRADHSAQWPQISSLPPNGLEILRPLLQYTVLPDLTNVVGPTVPRSDYLKATSTLRPPPSKAETKRGPGLPLSQDWFFSPLGELLHSANSMALAQTPPDWDPSELGLVRATLLLAQIRLSGSSSLSRSELLLNLMKVFMLEQGQQVPTNHSETDLFRDTTISTSLQALISITTSTLPSYPNSGPRDLEEACVAFLGSDIPFFQWYSDFMALYQEVSFSDHDFTQLLLPPLAMSYPVDYRRLFWSENTSILRGIKLQPGEVPLESASGLEVFKYPVEKDQNVLDGMIRAAAKGWLAPNTFLYDIAVHHLASVLWAASAEDAEEGEGDMRQGLMIGLLSMCPDALVRDILQYGGGESLQSPAERRSTVERLAGPRGIERLDKLSL